MSYTVSVGDTAMSGPYILIIDEGGELLYADEKAKEFFDSPGHYQIIKIPLEHTARGNPYLVKIFPPEDEIIKFFSVLIHEFKNPLGAIRALAQSMEAKYKDAPGQRDTINAYTGRIIREIDRLNSLLASVKYISRPSVRYMVNFNLSEVVQSVADLYRDELQQKGIEITLELKKQELVFKGNPDAFHQILSNLIKNAEEALLETERRHITVVLDQHNETVEMEVIDNGKGIQEDILNSLGEKPFISTKPYGMGLGLFVVQTLTKGCNGSLKFGKGPDGRGTRISISLPLVRIDEV